LEYKFGYRVQTRSKDFQRDELIGLESFIFQTFFMFIECATKLNPHHLTSTLAYNFNPSHFSSYGKVSFCISFVSILKLFNSSPSRRHYKVFNFFHPHQFKNLFFLPSVFHCARFVFFSVYISWGKLSFPVKNC
jgi:hypothetical protein